VEVLSPGARNERRDRDLKLKLYSRQGVQEYWIADWLLRTIQVYRRQEAELRLVATLRGDDVLTSPLLPGFSCPLPSLWPPDVSS
jgi:Uma2 family endonuclease